MSYNESSSMAEDESPSPPRLSRPAPPPIMSGQPAAGTVPWGFTPALDPPGSIPPSQGHHIQSENPPSSAAPPALLPSSVAANFAYVEPANDGYNWEMYMQRRMKGVPYPLTYYKCRHPECPALKRIKRDPHGHITDTKYKNHHNHPPPPEPATDPSHFTPQHVFQSKDCEADSWVVEPESKKRRFE